MGIQVAAIPAPGIPAAHRTVGRIYMWGLEDSRMAIEPFMGAEADRQVLMVARLGALLAVGAAPAAKLALARAKLNRLFTVRREEHAQVKDSKHMCFVERHGQDDLLLLEKCNVLYLVSFDLNEPYRNVPYRVHLNPNSYELWLHFRAN